MDTLAVGTHSNGIRGVFAPAFWLGLRLRRISTSFVCVVVIPTFFAVLYFGFLAHDIYVSESQFVVRSPRHQSLTGIGTLLQGTGLASGNDDVYSVQNFLSSRDAVERLQSRLRKSFAPRDYDFINRFPAIDGDQSFESLLRYYRRHVVDVDLDSTSSILSLTARAPSAEDAYRINAALLEMSEDFVNRMNQRARDDVMKSAVADVATAEREAKEAIQAVSTYRNAKLVFDPEKQSGLQLEQIGKLQEELIATRNRIADVSAVAKQNPQIPVLQNRAAVLQLAIDAETAKVAGDQHSLSSKSVDYEGVMLERDFAGKRLELALASLQQARDDVLKQQFYLERIAQPNKPDVAIEPRRMRNIAATLMMALITWGVLSLLIVAVKEHDQ